MEFHLTATECHLPYGIRQNVNASLVFRC